MKTSIDEGMLKTESRLSIELGVKRTARLFRNRGFKTVKHGKKGSNYIFMGSTQSQADHPREKAGLIGALLTSEQYSKDVITSTLQFLHGTMIKSGLDSSSSIMLIYYFPIADSKLEDVESIYSTICQQSGHYYYLEMLNVSILYEDRTAIRTTRGWKLIKSALSEIMIGNNGVPILVDLPPKTLLNDPTNQYYGGRIGDRYEYERLTDGEIGALWIPDMKIVSEDIRKRQKRKDDQPL